MRRADSIRNGVYPSAGDRPAGADRGTQPDHIWDDIEDDWSIVLNQGRIVEEGDHAGLLRRGGLYADLWSRQSGGFLPTEKPRPATGETLSANEDA